MNELTTKAIVIRKTDYRENDKLLSLFSLEKGKITALLKGCNKPNAKLKFAGQLFCFADFNLVQKGDFSTVTNANEIESFFEITSDFSKLQAGATVLEICDVVLNNSEPSTALFVQVLKALKVLCYENSNANSVLIKFLLDTFKISGYQLEMNKCQNCKGDFNTHILLDLDTGNFVCGLCKTNACVEVNFNQFTILKMIDATDYSRLASIKVKESVLTDILTLLNFNFSQRFQKSLKSLKYLQN